MNVDKKKKTLHVTYLLKLLKILSADGQTGEQDETNIPPFNFVERRVQ